MSNQVHDVPRPDRITLLDAVTTGSGVFVSGCTHRHFTVEIIWATGVTAGTVVVETAETPTYAGTWSNVTTVTFTSDKTDIVQWDGPEDAVRARVGTTVSGGGAPSVTVKIIAIN